MLRAHLSARPGPLTRRWLSGLTALGLGLTVAAIPAGPAAAATDLAVGKTISADSAQPSHPATHANDTDPATRWCAADPATGHWLQVDLGSATDLTSTQVRWEFARNYRYQVSVSTDGVAFRTVVDKTTATGAGQVQTDPFTATARYLRLTVTGLPAKTWASVASLSVFGTGTTTGGPTIQQWHPYDLSFQSSTPFANPYRDTSLSATFVGPGGVRLTVPGFFAGGGSWTVRFSPPATGTWTYLTTSTDAQLTGRAGTITAVDNTNAAVHGGLLVDPNNRHHYRYQDGTPYLEFQYEIDWLALMDFGDPGIPKARQLIDMVSANGFSEVLMNAFAYDTSWTPGDTGAYDFGPPTQYAWAGTNAKPDHSRMNEAYWQNFDRVIDYLYQKGITAHIFAKVYNKGVTWPANSSADEDMYLRFVTARYQAYPNIIWDFSKEVFKEPDQAYVANRLALIGRTDAYHRLRTIHDPDNSGTNGGYLNNPAIRSNVDILTDQHANANATIYSDALGKRAAFNMPITNSEYDYQVGNDGGHTYAHVDSAQAVLLATIDVLMAGAYPGYYYTYHAWDLVKYDETPAGIGRYKNLSTYFRTRTRWFELAPNDGLIGGGTPLSRHMLAKPGSEYLANLNTGGSLTFTITGAGTPLNVEWYNLDTGATQSAAAVGNGQHTFTSPWSTPALLHVR